MFVYQSRFLTRGEVWFDNESNGAAVDWILYRNRSAPVAGARSRNFYNRLIDLEKTPEELLAQMDPKTIAKINAAAEDKTCCEWRGLTDGPLLDEIETMWNQSIEAKRRWGMLNRKWLAEMISAQALELAAARDGDGRLLVYAGIFRDKHRVQQLMSVSPPKAALVPVIRSKTNRASCFLLWNTMLRLKQQGVRYFDFGGWYPGNEDIQLLGANAFKKSFGGQVVREYECEQILTLKGWIVLTGARLITRARDFRPANLFTWETNADAATA
jgi:hypothetical protein